jgi:hypothetical protein
VLGKVAGCGFKGVVRYGLLVFPEPRKPVMIVMGIMVNLDTR